MKPYDVMYLISKEEYFRRDAVAPAAAAAADQSAAAADGANKINVSGSTVIVAEAPPSGPPTTTVSRPLTVDAKANAAADGKKITSASVDPASQVKRTAAATPRLPGPRPPPPRPPSPPPPPSRPSERKPLPPPPSPNRFYAPSGRRGAPTYFAPRSAPSSSPARSDFDKLENLVQNRLARLQGLKPKTKPVGTQSLKFPSKDFTSQTTRAKFNSASMQTQGEEAAASRRRRAATTTATMTEQFVEPVSTEADGAAMRMSATNQRPITEAVVRNDIVEDVAAVPPFNRPLPPSSYPPPPPAPPPEADISEAAPAAAAAAAAPSIQAPPEASQQPPPPAPPSTESPPAPPPADDSALEVASPMDDKDELGLRVRHGTPANRVNDKLKKTPAERWQEVRKREREMALQRSAAARTSRLYPGELENIQEEEEEQQQQQQEQQEQQQQEQQQQQQEQQQQVAPPAPPPADSTSDSSRAPAAAAPASRPTRTTTTSGQTTGRRGHRRVTRRHPVTALPLTMIKSRIKKMKPPSVRVEPATTEGTEKKTKRRGQQAPARRPPSVKVKPYREFYEGGQAPLVVARPRSRRARQRLELDPYDTRKILKLNEDAKDVKYRLWTPL